MQLEYEILAILLTGLVAFAGGMRKAKSSCCCCSFELDRDEGNKVQAVKVVRAGSLKSREPRPPVPSVQPWWMQLWREEQATDIQEAERARRGGLGRGLGREEGNL